MRRKGLRTSCCLMESVGGMFFAALVLFGTATGDGRQAAGGETAVQPSRAKDARPATLPSDARIEQQRVGPHERGSIVVPTGQLIRPAGETLGFAGRPVDMAISPDQRLLFLKNAERLMLLDTATWKVVQNLSYGSSQRGSMHGLAVSADSAAVYVTTARNQLLEGRRTSNGQWQWKHRISLGSKKLDPCGIALAADGRTAYVALSINNTLAVVDLDNGKVTAEIPTGVCPFGVVLSADGRTAYVSNFGGRRARQGEHTELSAGTPVAVDHRSIAISGTITRVDLAAGRASGELSVGLHPSDLTLSADGALLFVANANSDSVSVVDTASFRVCETIFVRPEPNLPFGSITNALALSKDGGTLYAANGGNNAIAVIGLSTEASRPSVVRGFIPTGWFPGAVCSDGAHLYVANVKGEGSREVNPHSTGWNSHQIRGSTSKVAIPDNGQLAVYTKQVLADGRVPQMLLAMEKAHSGLKAVPVPRHSGEPSTIEHVVYVIKENRTYDQVFGDLPQGNGVAKLCTYGREITPNHHALAEEFVLLDNYYCNGVMSADGHQWATQGAVSDYQEKKMGDHPRGYFFGIDALTYAGCDFIWDSVLLHGRSFRNYGELDWHPRIQPPSKWFDIYADFKSGAGKIKLRPEIELETLNKYSCPDYPGWDLSIPDVVRLEAFLREFRQYEKQGQWPNFVIVYLPQDHTAGTRASNPTPRAMVADNDLALGRLVDAISHSRFWPTTAIFVNEDDPQAGWDHVDGHRSLCLVVSPYARRHAVVSQFYNQLSVLHTMERILGLPSTAQLAAQAPTMEACFSETPDMTPYTIRPNTIPLDERNKPLSASSTTLERSLASASAAMDLSGPDRIQEDAFNRILWHASMGPNVPYPAEFAGAHGRGLKAMKLKAMALRDDD
jgi:YVTN family beta-propeller protein